jgi:hypothetical protein
LNWKKSLHPPKLQLRGEEICISLHLLQQLRSESISLFTRSSTLKDVVEEEVLPKASVPRKEKDKSKGIEKPIEVIDRAFVQQKDKGKATEKPIEVININTPPSNPTFKRLIRKLREDRKEVARLKEEILTERKRLKELMDMYSQTLDLERFSVRRALPIHRKIKTLYRKNKSFQSQKTNLKEELQHFKDELVKRNLKYSGTRCNRKR